MQQTKQKVVGYAVGIWLLWGALVFAYDLSILKPKDATRGLASETESNSEKMLEQNTIPEEKDLEPSYSYQKLRLSYFHFQSDYIHQYGPTQNQTGFGFTLGGNHVTKK